MCCGGSWLLWLLWLLLAAPGRSEAATATNIALHRPVVSSGATWSGLLASSLTDGSPDTFVHPQASTGTLGFYFEVDLGKVYQLDKIVVRNRGDGCCPERLTRYGVEIYDNNGGFPGTIFSFNPDLTVRWSIAANNLNQGGPVLADDGTLLVAGTGADFRAYRTEPPCADADLDCDGSVGPADLALLLGAWGSPDADLDGDGLTGSADLAILLGSWG